MKYVYPLNAIHIDGDTVLLYSKKEVEAFQKNNRWGTVFGDPSLNDFSDRRWEVFNCAWIIRDDWGRKVHPLDFVMKNDFRFLKARHIRAKKAIELGLPIPYTGTSRPWKMNHPAKKNSGKGHRNRNRAKAIYDYQEYGVKNDVGYRVIPWEGY